MDLLRYWVTAFHVDGFRFDLGVTLGPRGRTASIPRSGFFDAMPPGSGPVAASS